MTLCNCKSLHRLSSVLVHLPKAHCIGSCLQRNMERVFEKPEVLYLSNQYVAIDKPYDLRINSNDPEMFTLEKLMDKFYHHLRDDSNVHGYRFTHRLDQATSGVICLSLTKKAASLLSEQFKKRKVTKHYIGIIYGHMSSKRQVIDAPIGKDSAYSDINRMCTPEKDTCVEPQESVTEVICLEEGLYDNKPASKVLLLPRTGRQHQLRVHCDYIGHRIVGDYMYSNREDTEPYRMMLHAYRLKFKLTDEDDEYIDILAKDPFTPAVDPKWQPSRTLLTYENAVQTDGS